MFGRKKRTVKEEVAKELSDKLGISEEEALKTLNEILNRTNIFNSKFIDMLATNEKFINALCKNEKLIDALAKKLDFNLTRRLILATGALGALTLGTGTAGAKLVLTDKFVELDGQKFYPSAVGAYDVIVMKDDANVWAEDRFGKVIAEGVSGEDDAEVIQNAIDYTEGIIYISKGEYIINKTIYIPSYRILRGDGYSTKLKLADNANCDMFRNKGFDAGYEVLMIEISNMLLDGNRAGNTVGSCICMQVFESKFKDLWICHAPEHGLRLHIETGENNIIQDCIISYCNSNGININFGATEINNNIIYCCSIGIFISGYNKKVVNNYIYGCAEGIRISNVRQAIIANNRINASVDGTGIFVKPTKVAGYYPEAIIILGNYIWGNFRTGIFLYGTTDYKIDNVIVRSNLIEYTGNVNRTGWAEAFISLIYTENNIIEHNEFIITGSGSTQPFYLANSNDIIRHNRGYPTENSGIATVTGDGTTTTFTVDIAHGLIKDTVVAKVTLDRDGTVDKFYLVDADGDGFKETIRVQVTFATAPADGEQVPIYWYAEVV